MLLAKINALREREDKLASLEKDQKDAYDAKLALLRKTHAQELASAKGEVEGQNVMLEMENQQLVANLEEKRAKIKSLQAELSRAVAKSKQIKDQSEMAKAAKAIAEEGRAEAEKALRRGTGGEPSAADARLEARIAGLEIELADTKASAAALGHAMWEHGMRPKDLNADAAAALDARGGDRTGVTCEAWLISWPGRASRWLALPFRVVVRPARLMVL